jgi:hypothetical protein
MKKYLLASLAVFVAWSVMDFVLHGLLLRGVYMSTASLWRPMPEMNMVLMHVVTAVTALAFTAIYAFFIRGGSPMAGAKYGLLFGIAAGFSMGMGTYAMMPIPMNLAWAWFLGYTVESAVGGAIAGWIVKGPVVSLRA